MDIPKPSNLLVYVEPDGRMTVDFLRLMLAWAEVLEAYDARLKALEP